MFQRFCQPRFTRILLSALVLTVTLSWGCDHEPTRPITGQPPAPGGAVTPPGGSTENRNGYETPGNTGNPPVKTRPTPAETRFDLIIGDGLVIDGSGQPGYRADVGITGDKITFIGDLTGATGPRIQATGLVVAPGFINPHSHTWDILPDYPTDPETKASLLQGITTEIGGVDGRSAWPVGAYLEQIRQNGTGVNYGTFVGQGTVRAQVMGWQQGPADALQLSRMQDLVRQAMVEGAFGLSTGLEYAPGSYATTAEVIALARMAGMTGGVYSTHMRSEGDDLIAALDEALRIGQEAGVPVNLSHLKVVYPRNWHKAAALFERVESALAAGQQVFGDVYPYLAPDYASHLPLAEAARLYPANLLVLRRAADPTNLGKTLAEVAAAWQVDDASAAFRLLASDPDTRVAGLITSREALLKLLAAPWAVVSSDGESGPYYQDPSLVLTRVHPRSYGTYPRVLRWSREGVTGLTLEATVRKLSGAVADHLRIAKRGYVRTGYFADLVVFDPQQVVDRATWQEPQQYPSGIAHVLVNGQWAVYQGQLRPRIKGGRIMHPQ